MNSDSSEAHVYKGWVLAKANRKAEGAQAYRQTLELMSSNHNPTASWYVRTATTALEEIAR